MTSSNSKWTLTEEFKERGQIAASPGRVDTYQQPSVQQILFAPDYLVLEAVESVFVEPLRSLFEHVVPDRKTSETDKFRSDRPLTCSDSACPFCASASCTSLSSADTVRCTSCDILSCWTCRRLRRPSPRTSSKNRSITGSVPCLWRTRRRRSPGKAVCNELKP